MFMKHGGSRTQGLALFSEYAQLAIHAGPRQRASHHVGVIGRKCHARYRCQSKSCFHHAKQSADVADFECKVGIEASL